MDKKIQVMLVEDHDLVRDALKSMLDSVEDFEVVSDYSSAEEAIESLKSVQPDIVLMDITLGGMTGLEATRIIKSCCQQVKVLALTIHSGEDYFFAMLRAGAEGYVPKAAASDELVQAIYTVFAGDAYIHHSVAGSLVQGFLTQDHSDEENRVSVLTDREREVLVLIGKGLRNQDIAERLDISAKTVSRHRENILKKLNLNSRSELIRYALDNKLIE